MLTLQTTPLRHAAPGRKTSRRRCVCRPRAESGSRLRPPNRRDVETTTFREDEDAVLSRKWLEGDVEGVRVVSPDEIEPVQAPELEILEEAPQGNYECYSFHEGVDVYVEQNDEGQFNLAQSFIYDRAARIFARPLTSEDVPDDFQSYQVMFWDTWISGDVCKGEEEKTELHKVFFLKQKPLEEERGYPEVDFKELYCIHGEKRTVEKTHVYDLTDEKTVDPVLCIREGNVVIDDTRNCPTPEGYASIVDVIDYLKINELAADDQRAYDVDFMRETGQGVEAAVDEVPDVQDADLE